MDKYKEEMFKFLTEPDNFETMVNVKNQYEEVREHLIVNFGNKLFNKLIELTKDKEKWVVEKNEDFLERWSSIWISKDNWVFSDKEGDSICVCFESFADDLHYGIWIDRNNEKLDLQEIYKLGEKSIDNNERKKYHTNWPCIFFTRENFQYAEDLKTILPKYVDEKAEEYANLLFEFALESESIIDEMAKMKK